VVIGDDDLETQLASQPHFSNVGYAAVDGHDDLRSLGNLLDGTAVEAIAFIKAMGHIKGRIGAK